MRPKPLAPRLLAELACIAAADAQARIDPRDHDDLSDRHQAPRTLTAADFDEAERLMALATHLENRARRARWSGPIWGAFDEAPTSEGTR